MLTVAVNILEKTFLSFSAVPSFLRKDASIPNFGMCPPQCLFCLRGQGTHSQSIIDMELSLWEIPLRDATSSGIIVQKHFIPAEAVLT
jgi:hypothetical protein